VEIGLVTALFSIGAVIIRPFIGSCSNTNKERRLY
jgi:hypothetical protein